MNMLGIKVDHFIKLLYLLKLTFLFVSHSINPEYGLADITTSKRS